MEISQEILSEIVVFQKYAKYLPENKRRESWSEICERNKNMHIKKYPHLKNEIDFAYSYVIDKKVLPSMRSMQFAGRPIELATNRIYNCAYTAADDIAVFSEAMFLLLGGTGLGYSVQNHHIKKLPTVLGMSTKTRKFVINDSIEGWADAIKVLVKSYFFNKSEPIFDFSDIREKGSRLVTSGGKAPGPDPLRICIEEIKKVFNGAIGRKLTSLEVHDILCYVADSVLAGGIRRAALICLFDYNDLDMLSCKSGNWWELNPQRGRANNSAVLLRQEITKQDFDTVWERVKLSGSGEPGIFWTNNKDWGTNPCVEIALRNCQFCNLVDINASDIKTQKEFNERVKIATFIATLQAGYTDFHYLRDSWKETTEKDALIGVGLTGISSGAILGFNLKESTDIIKSENSRVAKLININEASRTSCVKPAGTTSLVLGSSSGIHAWHNDYYIRRVRVGKNEPLYFYMKTNFPELVEDCKFKPHLEAVMSFPQKAPSGAIIRTETYLDLLERVKKFNIEWVHNGHRSGDNFHNVSCTISLKNDEWDNCGKWMWENKDFYTGISVLPYDNGTYVQAPFEDINEDQYEEMLKFLKGVDLKEVIEDIDNTSHIDQVACSGGVCEINI